MSQRRIRRRKAKQRRARVRAVNNLSAQLGVSRGLLHFIDKTGGDVLVIDSVTEAWDEAIKRGVEFRRNTTGLML